MDVTNTAGRPARGIAVLATVLAVNACRYDDPVTPRESSAARDRGTIANTSLMVDACVSPATTVTVSGASQFSPSSDLEDNTKLDASNAQFLLSQSVNHPVQYGGGTGICWSGGEVLGQFPPSDYWGDPYMHSKYGMLPGHTRGGGDDPIVENVRVFDYGDGISIDDPDQAPFGTIDNWTIRNVHIKYGRDDCVENDNYFTGTVESSFLDGCYTTVSSRGSGDPSSNVMTISNSLLRLQSMDVVFSSSGTNESQLGPGHAAFWKWDANGPQLKLVNNVFRADGPRLGHGNPTNQNYMAPPPGKLQVAECSGNVIAWFGTGTWAAAISPEQDPEVQYGSACFKVVSGAAAQVSWDSAVAVWQAKWDAEHSTPLPDIAPPIVSVFPPPQYWPATTFTGLVTLIATAVDDRAVTSVQFKLNGANIGAPVTQDAASGDATSGNGFSGPTKYRRSWHSWEVANGTYTLTAVAQDAAGHATASAGVPVTASNSAQNCIPYSPSGTVAMDVGATQTFFPAMGFCGPVDVSISPNNGVAGFTSGTDCNTTTNTTGGVGLFKIRTCNSGNVTVTIRDGATVLQTIQIITTFP
jgi:hypothetical protein